MSEQLPARYVLGVRRPMRPWVREALLAIGSIGLWGVAWWLTADFSPQSAAYVRFIVAGLFLFSTAHLATALWVPVRHRLRGASAAPVPEAVTEALPDSGEHEPRETPTTAGRRTSTEGWLLAAFVLSSCAYVILIPWLGILTATALFGLPWLGRAFSWNWRPILATAGLVALLYVILSVGLDVRMPDGLLI